MGLISGGDETAYLDDVGMVVCVVFSKQPDPEHLIDQGADCGLLELCTCQLCAI